MALEAVIFDMDGTLVDSMPYHMLSWQKFLESKGIEAGLEEIREKGHGTLFDIMPRFFGEYITREDSYRLAMEKEAIFREMYAPFMKPIEGLLQFLDELKQNGIKMALGTAADFSNTDFTLDTLQIRSYFDVIITSDIVPEGKPSPAVYNYAAKQLGINPSACIVFEDTFSGYKAGRAAEMKVAAITTMHSAEEWNGHGADLVLNNYYDVNFQTINRLFT
ncbi:MAG: HAD family phosphatase [Chitinophagaceae bacterium]|jgi:HAD superfamily hydrolase (TIGR01509 family)|nr:HAD family phosphatase [Chitinophagaceae bacterium]